MDRQQAIEIIGKEYLCVSRDCDIERSCGKCDLMMPSKEPILEAYKMAMDALAIPSAEPKEVYYSGDGYADGEMVYDIANCPNCDYEFEYSDFIWGCKFCPECGQALKWEGEQDETDN